MVNDDSSGCCTAAGRSAAMAAAVSPRDGQPQQPRRRRARQAGGLFLLGQRHRRWPARGVDLQSLPPARGGHGVAPLLLGHIAQLGQHHGLRGAAVVVGGARRHSGGAIQGAAAFVVVAGHLGQRRQRQHSGPARDGLFQRGGVVARVAIGRRGGQQEQPEIQPGLHAGGARRGLGGARAQQRFQRARRSNGMARR
jgi:hypothetical protein